MTTRPSCGKNSDWIPELGDSCIADGEHGFGDIKGSVINLSIDKKWVLVQWPDDLENWIETQHINIWTREKPYPDISYSEQISQQVSQWKDIDYYVTLLKKQGFTEIEISDDGMVTGRMINL